MIVSKPLADDTFDRFNRTLAIIEAVGGARVVAELELGKVAVQVLLATMLVHAAHTALEDRERAFDGVRVDRAIIRIDVGVAAVERGAMLPKALADRLIDAGFVGHKASFAVNVVEHDRLDLVELGAFDVEPLATATVAVNQCENGVLMAPTAA